MGATDRWRERIVLDVPGEVLMKILEVPDFNRPDRRVSFAMKGDVPVGFEEDYSRLPEVSERVCLYSTDDVVPFGCLATCIAVEEDHRADGRLILNAKFEDIQGTFWYVQEVLEERASRLSNGHGEGARLCGPASFTSGSRAVLVGMLREADEKPH